jgi:hypothetical protein
MFLAILTLASIINIQDKQEHMVRNTSRTIVHLDHPKYEGLQALVKRSEHIFIAKTTDSGTVVGGNIDEVTGMPEIPYTQYKLKIISVLKGQVTESVPTLSLLGGRINENEYMVEDIQKINIGQTYMFFALKGASSAYSPVAGFSAFAPLGTDNLYSIPNNVGFKSQENNKVTSLDVKRYIK